MLPDLPGWDSLSTVTRYHNIAEIAGIIILAGLVVAEVAAYQYGHRKDNLTEQQQRGTEQRHDEEMARLHLDTAKANMAAEELRRQNLELERAVSPRLLNQGAFEVVLRSFAGKLVQIDAVPYDAEAEQLKDALLVSFGSAKWQVEPANAKLPIFPGVQIWFEGNFGATRDPLLDEREKVVRALIAELRQQSIEANPRKIPAGVMRDETGLLPGSILLRVGHKPIKYFVEQRFPWIREQREHFEAIDREMRERSEAMRKRIEDGSGIKIPPIDWPEYSPEQ